MKKEIKQITNSVVGVTFTAQERKIYELEVGDIVDLNDMVVIGPRNFQSADHKKLGGLK